VQIRNYIIASRAERAAVARGDKPAADNLVRFTKDFDHDPGVAAPPPPGPAAGRGARQGGAG
jgi:hypothetical protein